MKHKIVDLYLMFRIAFEAKTKVKFVMLLPLLLLGVMLLNLQDGKALSSSDIAAIVTLWLVVQVLAVLSILELYYRPQITRSRQRPRP